MRALRRWAHTVFRFLHLFCPHQDIHQLPPPRSLTLHHKMGRGWKERWIQDYRVYQAHVLATREQMALVFPSSRVIGTPEASIQRSESTR
jgi:hypothetical protein